MSRCSGESCHQHAINHIVLATKRAQENNDKAADYHINSAKTFAEMHKEQLIRQGRKQEADEYMNGIDDHISRVNSIRQKHIKKSEKKCALDHSKIKKGEQCKCGYMNKSLKKGFLPPEPKLPKLVQRDFVSATEKQRVGTPKQHPKYDYKRIDELHPHDQMLAQERFSGKDHGKYKYPVDKETGRLAHAPRAPLAGDAPKAQPHSYKEIQEHHKPGSNVEIRGVPGHHGRFGIVSPSSPYMPGKIAVQVGASSHEKVFVEPHQVVPRLPKTKIEKAIVALVSLRKALDKGE